MTGSKAKASRHQGQKYADSCTVYLFEAGFPNTIPGFKKNFPAATFPFWGNYYILDFAITNFRAADTRIFYVISDNRHRSLISFITSRWERETSNILFLEGGLDQFIKLLKSDSSDTVILSTLSLVSFIESEALSTLKKNLNGQIVKLSINKIPVNIFLAERKKLIKVLESSIRRHHQRNQFEAILFEEILLTSFDILEDIPGVILFHNNLMQLYRENLRLVSNISSREYSPFFSRLNEVKLSDRQSVIESQGLVKDSIISSGSRIEGYVENSIIFSDCLVRKGAKVTGSIVMNNNRIGSGAVIQSTLIFPSLSDSTKSISNIGEDATIGGRRSIASNEKYPEHIYNGITVLGFNPEIPSGYTIEPGCFVGPEVPFQHLRNLKQMKKGSTVLWDMVQ